MHIIIDGYNLIRQSPSLAKMEEVDLEHGREGLLEMLRRYKKLKRHFVTVVFDGDGRPAFSDEVTTVKGIRVIYSRTGKTADGVIRRLAGKEGERACIVTSDRELAGTAESYGATVITSQEFEHRMNQALNYDEGMDVEQDQWLSSSRFSTKKKGPSHKAPRKKRKAKRKLSKL